jgi:hypothetical protein
MKYKERLKAKNEQLVMRWLQKRKTPLTITCRELADKIKIYDQKFNLKYPSRQGILDILLRLQKKGIITRDISRYKQKLIINQ